MNASNIIDPGNFDTCLFALDMINFVFLKSSKLNPDSLAGRCPKFVCKDFSEALKRAVQIIKDSLTQDVDEEFVKFQERNDLRLETYVKYSKNLRKVSFYQGFDVEKFLYYSVHMASMAYRFYNRGVHKAQTLAVSVIADYFQDCSVNYSLWEAFDEIAEKIVCVTSVAENLSSSRSLIRNVTASMNYFASPEMERKEKCGKKGNADSIGGCVMDSTVKEDFLDSKDLSKSKSNNRKVSSCSLYRWMKECSVKEHKTMPSLHESLESSLEQLSISSMLSLKPIKDSSNSPPVDPGLKWKPGILKKRTPKSSLERQIFKFSPRSGNRGKAEGVNWK